MKSNQIYVLDHEGQTSAMSCSQSRAGSLSVFIQTEAPSPSLLRTFTNDVSLKNKFLDN